jgi:hypothetical protein
MSERAPSWRVWIAAALAALLAACASGPPPPDWQANAKDSMDRALAAYLKGDTRVAMAEFERARGEIARTGRADLLARAELMKCAARVASLVFGPCEGFEKLRPDAQPAERAYADYLAARAQPQDVAMLPSPQRAVAMASSESAAAALQEISDPLSRLVGAAVLFQSGRASPAAISLAIDTASEQGWRRPLLAWLNVQVLRAEKAGDSVEAERLRRRIAVVENAK